MHEKTGRPKGRVAGVLRQAEENAAVRDRLLEPLKKPNLAVVNEQERIARSMNPQFTLVKVEDKNKAPFTQLIAENVRYLLGKQYLSRVEQAFIFALTCTVELYSNALVRHEIAEDGLRSTGEFLTVTELAELAGVTRQTASSTINGLVKKGILYEVLDPEQIKEFGRVVTERVLFVNPEIMFAGDKNRINATLCRMVIGADRIERTGLRMPWKVWLKEGHQFGRLYRRQTYNRLRRSRTDRR